MFSRWFTPKSERHRRCFYHDYQQSVSFLIFPLMEECLKNPCQEGKGVLQASKLQLCLKKKNWRKEKKLNCELLCQILTLSQKWNWKSRLEEKKSNSQNKRCKNGGTSKNIWKKLTEKFSEQVAMDSVSSMPSLTASTLTMDVLLSSWNQIQSCWEAEEQQGKARWVLHSFILAHFYQKCLCFSMEFLFLPPSKMASFFLASS